jgi:MYXO-CTERM domain-containing protein
MFWHVNRAYTFFQGFGMTDLSTKPLPTISNLMLPAGYQTQDLAKMSNPNLAFAPFQNAFFAPADPLFSSVFGIQGAAMWFGQGPKRDYSYDGDVIYHEFTHAVVDHTLKLVGTWHADSQGLIDSPGAMNEGLADLFSGALSGDPKLGEYAAQDLAPGLTAIRDLSNQLTCPANVSGEVHSDSQFWSAGFWTARAGLDPTKQPAFDKALFDVMAATPGGDIGFEDLAALFVTSVKTEIDTVTADLLQKELEKRGTLPGCKRVIEYSGKSINGSDPFLAYAVFTPGLKDALLGGAAYAPGPIQVHVPVPAAATLSVTFSTVQSQGSGLPIDQGTPFAPKLLVRWGAEPISFEYGGDVTSNADATVDAPISAGHATANVEVPVGTTSAYLMIVNAGDQQGGYKNLGFAFSGEVADAGSDAGAVDAGSDAASDAGGPAKKSESDGDSGGCGCHTAGGHDGPLPFALGAIALAALSIFSRRR